MPHNQTALECCRCADLMTCDPGGLVDLQDVRIDTSLPVPKRLERFVHQVGNPYLFKVDDVIVKASFQPQAERTLSDALPGLLIL